MLRPVGAKNPNALLKALSRAHRSSLTLKAFFGMRYIFGGTFTYAHISGANQVGGTMIVFAKKRCRIFWGETYQMARFSFYMQLPVAILSVISPSLPELNTVQGETRNRSPNREWPP
jgi:hypothetical protein